MPRSPLWLVLAATVAIAVTIGPGCQTQTASDAIATKAIWAEYAVAAGPGATTATASWRVGESSNTYLDLQGGDAASCDGVGLVKSTGALGGASYHNMVPRRAPGESYRFVLQRTAETVPTDVPAVTPLDVTAPADAAKIKPAEALVVSWSPSAPGSVHITLSGPCLDAVSMDAEDNGSATIPGSQIRLAGLPPDGGAPTGCAATLTLRRQQTVAIGPPFVGGRAESSYTASRAVTVTP